MLQNARVTVITASELLGKWLKNRVEQDLMFHEIIPANYALS